MIENIHGWANYYVMGEIAYLENVFIYPESRQKQEGTMILTCVEMQAKEIHGCKELKTTINKLVGNPDRTLQICLKRGFSLQFADNSAIILRKEL